jgi:hypothetical protein
MKSKIFLPVLSLLVSTVNAEDIHAPPWHANVQVTVGRSDESKPNEAETKTVSYLKRELRSLRDVTVVETNADYTINLIAFETSTVQGLATGYALSYFVTEPVRSRPFSMFFGLNAQQQEVLSNYLSSAVLIDGHYLYIVPLDGLRTHAENFITHLDTDWFEPSRRNHEKFYEGFMAGLKSTNSASPAPARPSSETNNKSAEPK